MKRLAAIGIGALFGLGAHGTARDEADIEQLVHLRELERTSGMAMPLELGLCVDDTLGQRRLAAPEAPGEPRDQDRLRQARKTCELRLRAFAPNPPPGRAKSFG